MSYTYGGFLTPESFSKQSILGYHLWIPQYNIIWPENISASWHHEAITVPLRILRGFCKLSGHRLKTSTPPWIDVNRSDFLRLLSHLQTAILPPRYWTNTCSKATTRLKFAETRLRFLPEKQRSRHLTDQASAMTSPKGVVLRTKQHQLGHSGFNTIYCI